MNGTEQTAHDGLAGHLDFSDIEGDEAHDDHPGDYSTRFDELMSDGEDVDGHSEGHTEDDEEEGFLYTGVDSEPAGGYQEQLRDVLGPDHEDDEVDERHPERSLVHEVAENEKFAALIEDEAGHVEVLSDRSPSTSSVSPTGLSSPPNMTSNLDGSNTPSKLSRPFLHPTISRLRSATPQPQPSRVPSAASAATMNSHMQEGGSAAHSHFSALSRSSSVTNVSGLEQANVSNGHQAREVFRWTQLRSIRELLYTNHPSKASTVLGSQSTGSPTVLAANGLICVGTDIGRILVFDFKQNLKCVCGTETPGKAVGPVTALALSFDHTYVAAGHTSGHIQLFDLRTPKAPVRFVPPTTLAAVASGRQEGHLVGSRIVSIGFIAGRHTALVSADDSGLAFYHSLGKVLFVEASDILRILGKYPDEDVPALPLPGSNTPDAFSGHHHFRRRKSRKPSTILAMAPLPFGTASHSTDSYHLIALLTPIKLVIVGLKPSPKTWYRRHREVEEAGGSKAKFKGALAWFPSVIPGDGPLAGTERSSKTNGVPHASTIPMLVYSWGNTLNLLRVTESRIVQQTKNPKTGKVSSVEVGRIVFEEAGRWTAEGDVLAVQWLNVNQIVVLTPAAFEVYDVHSLKLVEREPFDAWSLVSPILSHTINGTISYSDAITEVAHSVRVYKGKIFLLGQHEIQVGTLLTWADRILSFVQNGDFLSAIELTRSYYVGEAPGNKNGLPDTPEKLKLVVGEKMRELMVASAQYAFSEERMTDSTHITADGRGVDRTSLFEDLVSTCVRACMALDDFDFLFEDLFQYYDDNGISRIFLFQLEPFMLNSDIRHVPPRITQRLIAFHDEDNRPDLAERVIWHIDPDCLDINQAITLCQNYQLYDALIYVYTRAMRDFVSPVVELLGLIRRVQQYRKARGQASPTSANYLDEQAIEPVIMNSYKIYPYLANVLTGLTYPSEEPLPEEDAFQAKNDVYTFLFFGRSNIGEGGKLVLTSDEENGIEPTYPYVRLLLRFDPEAFLHTLDLAFEDAYLNDQTRSVSRLVIIKILLEILSSPGLSPSEITFLNIFIARNVPKYPQFIFTFIPPSVLHSILIGLAEDPDSSTREDRQLAAEYLLSAYTPHESGRILALFKEAGFYRILRSWHQQERQWSPLLLTYLQDPDMPSTAIFPSIQDVLLLAERFNKGILPRELVATVFDSLPTLLLTNIANTAALLDKHLPSAHDRALETLGPNADHERFVYLRYLLGPPLGGEDDDELVPLRQGGPSTHVSPSLRQLYISLQCRYDPSSVITVLHYLPPDFLDVAQVTQTCEENEVFDGVIWLIDRDGDPRKALAKADSFDKQLSARLADELTSSSAEAEENVRRWLHALESIAQTATSICLEHSQPGSGMEVPLEDIWFQLLRSEIDSAQRVAGCCSLEALSPSQDTSLGPTHVQLERETLSALRSLVQRTFASLMSVSSTKAVSFPRLFKRLVGSASKGHVSKGTLYTEFRTILTGMLESFRSEGDMLVITKHLVDRDLFGTIEQLAHERVKGWAPSQGACYSCGEAFFSIKKPPTEGEPEPGSVPIVVSRTGAIYHSRCLPPDLYANHSSNVQ